jgi:threonine dehydrogenase-like Zn-dependent dehydrogenase
MRALCWPGKGDVRVDTVPDPKIEHPRDAIIKITACAICGSDLHLLNGYQPTMESGDILGHENMGEVIELGTEISNLKVGDRVVVPFTISCGQYWFCQKGLFACADPPTKFFTSPERTPAFSFSSGMAEVVSLVRERERLRPSRVSCNKCSERMVLTEYFVAADGRPWKIYKCSRCKNYEWRCSAPRNDWH